MPIRPENRDRCPGSGYRLPRPSPEYGSRAPHYRTCPRCRRPYAVNSDGHMRAHRGLTSQTGGCPYVCAAATTQPVCCLLEIANSTTESEVTA